MKMKDRFLGWLAALAFIFPSASFAQTFSSADERSSVQQLREYMTSQSGRDGCRKFEIEYPSGKVLDKAIEGRIAHVEILLAIKNVGSGSLEDRIHGKALGLCTQGYTARPGETIHVKYRVRFRKWESGWRLITREEEGLPIRW